jgi:hypothetical protein
MRHSNKCMHGYLKQTEDQSTPEYTDPRSRIPCMRLEGVAEAHDGTGVRAQSEANVLALARTLGRAELGGHHGARGHDGIVDISASVGAPGHVLDVD